LPKLPGIRHLDAIRALQKAGFVVLRQGKHVVMAMETGS
jgi:predicted RNA binding protein YcfA (HicA-like mRNA interferase family)